MQSPPFKIVVIGPESTGKSSLCAALAKKYKASWCPEYARQYLQKQNKQGHYGEEDLLFIARGQTALEDACQEKARSAKDRFLFIDTDMYVMKVWSEFAFDRCHHWILEQIAHRKYDYYLLCGIDLPWMPDPLREYPDPLMRQNLFNHYLDLLIHQATPFSVILGQDEERLANAVAAINRVFP